MRPLLYEQGGVPIAFARSPFSDDVYREVLPAGLTIGEMVALVPGLPDRFRAAGVVRVNGSKVPREWWAYCRPRADGPLPVAVTLHLRMGGPGGGGGGGRKNTFALVASLALIAATTAISAGALGPITGGVLAAGWAATALATGVGVLGGLAIAALSPPPKFAKEDQPTGSTDSLGSASLEGNVLPRAAVIPRALGTIRAYPSLGSFPLAELIGEDEYVEALFALNGPHKWEDIRADGATITDDPNIQYEVREGFDSDDPITLVTRQGFMDTAPVEFSRHVVNKENGIHLDDQATPANSLPRWHSFVSRRAPDEIWMHLLFPEGMQYRPDPDGTLLSVPVRLRMRPLGTSTWINLPEIHFRWNSQSPFQHAIKLLWQTSPALPQPVALFGPWYARLRTPQQTVAPAGIGGWAANDYFRVGSGDEYVSNTNFTNPSSNNVRRLGLYSDRVEVYLGHDVTVFPTDQTWEIQAMRGQPYSVANFIQTTYAYNDGIFSGVFDFFGYATSAGVKYIGLVQTNVSDRIVKKRTCSVWNEYPVVGTGLALLAVRARNRALQKISALVSGYVPDWNGSSWAGNVVTSNPAPHYRYMLTGPLNADPLPTELVDDDVLVDWRARCAALGYECNTLADGQILSDLLKVAASCGYARPRQSEKWGVLEDRDRSAESVVQIFSPRTMANFRWKKGFPRLPHGFRIRYRDSALDYEEAPELIVYADGYSAMNAERLEEANYDGLVSPLAVMSRAEFDLAQASLRGIFYTCRVDAEALVATRGDLVGVQHDVLMRQAGFARIKEKIVDGFGMVTGLVLDSVIPTKTGSDVYGLDDVFAPSDVFNLDGTTGIAIRTRDGLGELVTGSLTEDTGEFATVTFETPFADPGDDVVGPGCETVSGALGSEYLRLILIDVQPGDDMTFDLTFVDEAPELWLPSLLDNDNAQLTDTDGADLLGVA